MIDVPQLGEEWKPWYPARNRIGLPIEFVPRRIRVRAVHDFSGQFLPADEFLKRPMVRRGSILVFGDDLDLGGPVRKFYLHATSEYDLPLLRIACLDDSERIVDWLGRDYEPTFFDRSEMLAEIGRWNEEEAGCGLHLGICYAGDAA
jgi:hypothetical protein